MKSEKLPSSEKVTREIIQSAIDAMGEKFDSHNIIFWIMKKYPKEYIQELHNDYCNKENPFQYFHAKIAKQLKLEVGRIKKGDEVKSINVLGNLSLNKSWRKK